MRRGFFIPLSWGLGKLPSRKTARIFNARVEYAVRPLMRFPHLRKRTSAVFVRGNAGETPACSTLTAGVSPMSDSFKKAHREVSSAWTLANQSLLNPYGKRYPLGLASARGKLATSEVVGWAVKYLRCGGDPR